MVRYPGVQKRAQAELDRVVGTDRLPTYDDRADLPYVEALMREMLRCHPPVPAGNALVSKSGVNFAECAIHVIAVCSDSEPRERRRARGSLYFQENKGYRQYLVSSAAWT